MKACQCHMSIKINTCKHLPDSDENPSDGKSNSGNEKHESVIEENVKFM